MKTIKIELSDDEHTRVRVAAALAGVPMRAYAQAAVLTAAGAEASRTLSPPADSQELDPQEPPPEPNQEPTRD